MNGPKFKAELLFEYMDTRLGVPIKVRRFSAPPTEFYTDHEEWVKSTEVDRARAKRLLIGEIEHDGSCRE